MLYSTANVLSLGLLRTTPGDINISSPCYLGYVKSSISGEPLVACFQRRFVSKFKFYSEIRIIEIWREDRREGGERCELPGGGLGGALSHIFWRSR